MDRPGGGSYLSDLGVYGMNELYTELGSTLAQTTLRSRTPSAAGRRPLTLTRAEPRAIKSAEASLAKLGKLKGKLRRKSPGTPTLTMMLEIKERSLQSDKSTQERALKVIGAMYALLNEWECPGWEASQGKSQTQQMDELIASIFSSTNHRFS
jgi:hypothetical protein